MTIQAADYDPSLKQGAALTGTELVTAYAAAATLVASQSASTILWNAAAGFTITLPAPVVGLVFTLAVQVSVTSSNHKVITDAATTFLIGGIIMAEAADTNAGLGAAMDGTSNRAVTMNGSTTGGLIGTCMTFTCIAATKWLVSGLVYGSGTLSTPVANS